MDEHALTGPPAQRKAGGTLAGDFSQLALWSAANLAGMATAWLLVREPFFRRLMNKLAGRRRSVPRPSLRQSLPMLADAVVGSTRSTLLSVFGPPRTAALDRVPSPSVHPTFLQASTWYYALPRNGLMAMAINFSDDHAASVEFFQMPAAGAPLAA